LVILRFFNLGEIGLPPPYRGGYEPLFSEFYCPEVREEVDGY